MSTSKFFDFIRHSNKFLKLKFRFQLNKISNLSSNKIVALNFSILFNYFCFSRIESRRKNSIKNLTNKSDFDYLLNLENLDNQDKINISNKKTPKIIYISNSTETDDEKIKIKSNFEKMHSKFSDLDSYIIEPKRKVDSFSELENFLTMLNIEFKEIFGEEKSYSATKEKLTDHPFIIINKYGDFKSLSLEELTEISKPDSNFHFLEKLQILNNKNDLLLLNDYDNAFVIYLDHKNVDYSNESFKVFRKMFFLLNFFNIKFFVATKEHSEFLNKNKINLEINNVYLIKRENMLDEVNHSSNKTDTVTYEEENFRILNLTEEVLKENTSVDSKINKIIIFHLESFFLNLMKILLKRTNFVYYSNHSFKKKQGLEIFNLYFKDIPYYLYYTNLKDDHNKKGFVDILDTFRENLEKIHKNFVFVVVDNEKNTKNSLFKLFEQKTFDLKESTLKQTKFEEHIQHYEANITKKLKIINFNKDSIVQLIKKEESAINIDNNYYFKKKVHPENYKLLNHLMFDMLIKQEDKTLKVILIENKDNKFNLDVDDKVERLAHVNKLTKTGINFFHMHNSEENLAHFVERYGENYRPYKNENFPQLLVIRQDKIYFIPQKLFLRQNGYSDEELNKEISIYLN